MEPGIASTSFGWRNVRRRNTNDRKNYICLFTASDLNGKWYQIQRSLPYTFATVFHTQWTINACAFFSRSSSPRRNEFRELLRAHKFYIPGCEKWKGNILNLLLLLFPSYLNNSLFRAASELPAHWKSAKIKLKIKLTLEVLLVIAVISRNLIKRAI